jgi:hypothetical protein
VSSLLSLHPLILCLLSGALLTLALLFNYFGKIPDGYQMVELVSFLRSAIPPVNHPGGVWRLHLKIRKCISATLINTLSLCNTIDHYNIALSLDTIVICRHMCVIDSWAHIWCTSGFVRKTGCDMTSLSNSRRQHIVFATLSSYVKYQVARQKNTHFVIKKRSSSTATNYVSSLDYF